MTERVSNVDLERLQKIAIAAVPFISGTGLLLGFAYGAGYFRAIDPRLYFLFSLSEHILFAVQILPLGMCLVAALILMTVGQEAETVRFGALAPSQITSIILSGVLAYFIATLALVIAIGVAVVWLIFVVELVKRKGLLIRLVVYFIPLFVIAYMLGYSKSILDQTQPFAHELTFQGESAVQGTLMRSGSQGILYVNAQRRVTFRKSESVVSIVTIPR